MLVYRTGKASKGKRVFLSLHWWEPEKYFVTVTEDYSHSLTDSNVLVR